MYYFFLSHNFQAGLFSSCAAVGYSSVGLIYLACSGRSGLGAARAAALGAVALAAGAAYAAGGAVFLAYGPASNRKLQSFVGWLGREVIDR